MARRKMPERYKSGPKKGQFKPKRKSTAAARTRRSYKRNPAKPDVVKTLTGGVVTASQVLVGKAATRAVPDLLKLPKAGNAGLAVELAVALGLGYVAAMFFSRPAAAAIMAGGMTAPLEKLVVSADIPYLSEYLSPEAQAEAVQGYVQPHGGQYKPTGPRRLAGYVQPQRGRPDVDEMGRPLFN